MSSRQCIRAELFSLATQDAGPGQPYLREIDLDGVWRATISWGSRAGAPPSGFLNGIPLATMFEAGSTTPQITIGGAYAADGTPILLSGKWEYLPTFPLLEVVFGVLEYMEETHDR